MMNKFVIENAIINKSEKDIKLGEKYTFCDGFNIVCGENEAGKSSLMNFIINGFFKTKSSDEGQIFFKVQDSQNCKHYRADIKDKRQTTQRCIIYNDNTQIEYSFFENLVNSNYFQQGFVINLDDLMSLENKTNENLINLIKDPSGEKLCKAANEAANKAKKILGENNRLTKDCNSILNKITDLNAEINELASAEDKYNSAIAQISLLSEHLTSVQNQKSMLDYSQKLRKTLDEIKEINEQILSYKLQYNDKLSSSQNKYFEIVKNSGIIISYEKQVEKNSEKLNESFVTIHNLINKINAEYSSNLNVENIKNISVNSNDLKSFKEDLSEIDKLNAEISEIKIKVENLKDLKSKFENEKSLLSSKNISAEKYEKLKLLYEKLAENLNKYNYFAGQISDMGRNEKNYNIKYVFLGAVIAGLLSLAASVAAFIQKQYYLFALILLAAVMAIGCAVSCKFSDKTSLLKELQKQQNEVAENLKSDLKNYDEKISSVESYLIGIKADSTKQNIQNEIKNYLDLSTQIEQKNSEIDFNEAKIQKLLSEIIEKTNDVQQLQNNAEIIIKKSGVEYLSECKNFPDFISKIENVRRIIEDCNNLKSENEKIVENIKNLKDDFNNFIISLDIKISYGNNFADNLDCLKKYNDNNINVKSKIDSLTAQLQSLQKQKSEIEDVINKKFAKNEFTQIYESDYSTAFNRLNNEEADLINEKSEAEYQKKTLEACEQISSKKIQKNILIEEYRAKIFELYKQKLTIKMIDFAKKSFDKNQPNLQMAQKYFAQLTGGKYHNINLDLMQVQQENKFKNWSELSRGTKEQLYFALRLGYAANYSIDRITQKPNGKPNLPLIADDTFVNFDEQRTFNALKCLTEFSKTNQVIFFTCHWQQVLEYLKSIIGEESFNVIKL